MIFKHCDFEKAGVGATHLLVLLSSGYVRKFLQVCKNKVCKKTGEKTNKIKQTQNFTNEGEKHTWLSDKLPSSSAMEMEAAFCSTIRPALTPPFITWACKSSFSSFNLRDSSRKDFNSDSSSRTRLVSGWSTSSGWSVPDSGFEVIITSSELFLRTLNCERKSTTWIANSIFRQFDEFW